MYGQFGRNLKSSRGKLN